MATTTPINYQDPYGSRVAKIFDKYPYGQAIKYHNIFKSFLCPGIGQGNKPVDLGSGTFNNECLIIYPPTLLALDTKVLMAVYNHNKSVADNSNSTHPERPRNSISGYTEIKFIENTYAVATSNGNYTLLLKIEFTPDQVTAPVPPSKTVFTGPVVSSIKQDMPIKSASLAGGSMAAIIGSWDGTQTSDEGLYPNQVFFQLTNNGSLLWPTQKPA